MLGGSARRWSLVLAASWAVGCTPGLDDPARFRTDCTPDFDTPALLRERCSGAGCHGGPDAGAPASGLDLYAPGPFARMADLPSTGCQGLLVSTAEPDKSVLLDKVRGTQACGARMPLSAPPLGASAVACLRAWVVASAAERADSGADARLDAPADAEAEATADADAEAAADADATAGDASDDADASTDASESDADASLDDAGGE